MFSIFQKPYQKAVLFSVATVAGFAATGTIMINPVQAATMSYKSEFNLTSNSLDSEVATGNFSFTKTELASGKFSYKLISFDASFGAFGINKSLSLNDIKANPTPFTALNQAFVPDKYQNILPSVLTGADSNYVGDGDFPPDDFTYQFTGEEFKDIQNQLTPFVSAFMPSIDTQQSTALLNLAFGKGGKVSFTTTQVSEPTFVQTSVPEPTTIFGIGVVGVGLIATRRKNRYNSTIRSRVF
ncbi:MAG: PEP-CTERM sorting domain-containing protein [Nostocales cyanobacterium 94392]|nr:PEP-CTERM sorting domain-containing protein [Nostocales cyanobacterium 94392]